MATTTCTFKFAGIQLAVGADKASNVTRAQEKIAEAAKNGAKVICLPVRALSPSPHPFRNLFLRIFHKFSLFKECFNSPYGNQYFAEYAERLDESSTLKSIKESAIQHGVYIIAGAHFFLLILQSLFFIILESKDYTLEI